MTMFWPYTRINALPTASQSRRARIRELEARIDSFLIEKEGAQETCNRVLGNVRDVKSRLRGELAELK